MSTEVRVLLCTCPPEAAETIAEGLLERRLVACVNALPGAFSRYWWKGRLESGEETLLLLKTRAEHVPGIVAALGELHPYDVPELLSLPVEAGGPAYLDWVSGETAPKGRGRTPEA